MEPTYTIQAQERGEQTLDELQKIADVAGPGTSEVHDDPRRPAVRLRFPDRRWAEAKAEVVNALSEVVGEHWQTKYWVLPPNNQRAVFG
jgi:hypothetical protein